MSKFAYFNFTCGNFTSGRGHIRFRQNEGYMSSSVESLIDDHLNKNGEKNCNVIIERFNDTEMTKDSPEHKRVVNYQIDSRWHSQLPALLGGMVAPVLVPKIIEQLK